MIQQPDPIPFHPLPLSLGLLHYLWVGHTIIRLVVLQSGQLRYNRVSHATIGSGALLSGQVHCYWVRCTVIGSGALLLGRVHCYWVGRTVIGPIWCAFPPCFYSTPLHTLPHHSLQSFSLYLHASLFSFCYCDPGHLSLALALPYPCHLSLCYFSAVIPPFSLQFTI